MNRQLGFGFLLFSYPIFLEQPIIFGLYLYSWVIKNHDKILENSRLQHVSLTARITLISNLVMELSKSQEDIAVLTEIWSSMWFSGYITIPVRENVTKFLWDQLDFCTYHMPPDSPSQLFQFGKYSHHKLKFLCSLKPGTVSVVHYFRPTQLQNLEKSST